MLLSLSLMPFLLTSELDRGTEVETTEGSSTLVAPDQLEARLMSCCWCCQGVPSGWRTTILGIIIIIIILRGRLVKERMIRELGHETSSSGLLTGL